MKSLELHNKSFKRLETHFQQWLKSLGYSKSLLYSAPLAIREYLHFLETKKEITSIRQMSAMDAEVYYQVLQCRTNQKQGYGALGNASLNKHQQAIKLFFSFLRKAGGLVLDVPELKTEEQDNKTIEVLSPDEIAELFEAVNTQKLQTMWEHLRTRDRAILTIYYGCGLRRSEGVYLNTQDVDLQARVITVRQAKGYKERIVPIHSKYISHLEEYIYYCRARLVKTSTTNAFFLSIQGKRIDGGSIAKRLTKLLNQAQIDKKVSLHTLRHSIATHLLENGMPIEMISRFLGHSSLESTQRYTHLI